METVKRESRFSILPWIVPLIALIATVWLAYKTLSEAGVEISVNFTDGSSLKEGKTLVKYKGFSVGKVTSLTVAPNLKSIDAHITLNHDVGDIIAREGSDFWIVEPKISVSEISGLDTIISGSYIEIGSRIKSLDDMENHKEKFHFKGYVQKPLNYYSDSGVNIILETASAQDIKKGTLLFYKNIETGRVLRTRLNGKRIEIYANIFDTYKHLINSSTKFYTNSGIKIDASLDGINVNMNSLASLVGGGISFETLDDNAKKVEKNHRFTLLNGKEELNIDTKIVNFQLENADGLKEGSPILYKGFKIGRLANIDYTNGKITAKGKIEKKYDYLLSEKSKFYKAVSSIETLNFNNLETLIKGSFISLIYKEGNATDSFRLYSSYRDLELENMTIIKLKSEIFSNLNVGSDLYYKNMVIGRVLNADLSKDFGQVLIDVAIESKYDKLLNDKTLFYIISSPLIEMENFDISLNFERFKPFLFGGIGLEYCPSKNSELQKSYRLYSSNLDMNKKRKTYREGLRVDLEVEKESIVDEDTHIVLNSVDIGSVESFDPLSNPPKATIYIEEKYKKYLKPGSKFYKKNAVEFRAGLGGIDFKVDSLGRALKGSIVLDNTIKELEEEKLSSGYKYKLYEHYENLPLKKGKRFTLFSGKGVDLSDSSKIYYKKIPIGEIEKITLSDDATETLISILIYDRYSNLVRKNSIFYNVGGINIDVSLLGADIKAENLQSILSGGVSLITPNIIEAPAKARRRFLLNNGFKEEWLGYNPKIKL